jgi:hypothetical protein
MSRIMDILDKQGLPKPETDEQWRQYEADKKARRQTNVLNAAEVLQRNGVKYIRNKSESQTMFEIIDKELGTIRYWPEEGRWIVGSAEAPRFGVRNLVKFIKGELK